DIQSRSGSLTIKGFTVPLGESLEIRGGLRFSETGAEFIPPAGTNGFFARSIRVPGGLLGIDFPIPGNTVLATPQLVGPASNIRVVGVDVAMPVKLKLSNPLLGPNCSIGTDRNPVHLDLIIGTTAPPPPNRPISGGLGAISNPDPFHLIFTGNRNV